MQLAINSVAQEELTSKHIGQRRNCVSKNQYSSRKFHHSNLILSQELQKRRRSRSLKFNLRINKQIQQYFVVLATVKLIIKYISHVLLFRLFIWSSLTLTYCSAKRNISEGKAYIMQRNDKNPLLFSHKSESFWSY